MGDNEYAKIFGPLTYRAADKFFKFVSWALIIALIRFARKTVDSSPLYYLEAVAAVVFSVTLMVQAFHLATRDPVDWGIPAHLRTVFRIGQVLAGLALLVFLTSPYLLLDDMIADFAAVKSR